IDGTRVRGAWEGGRHRVGVMRTARNQFLAAAAATIVAACAIALHLGNALTMRIAVPIAAACLAASVVLVAWGAIRAASKGASGALKPGIGSVLLFTGAVAAVVYVMQPWRSCDYDDVPAGCTALPEDVTGVTVSALVA